MTDEKKPVFHLPIGANIPKVWAVHYDQDRIVVVIPSKSVTGRFYNVTMDRKTRILTCECPGFKYKGMCHHISGLIRLAYFASKAKTVPNTVLDATMFDGETFDADLDAKRLNRQLNLVFQLICDGNWHTLADISDTIGEPQASISARLRDLRKEKFGGYKVLRQRVADSGLFQYRLDLEVDHV
jgi:hypothetical protein